MNVTLACDLDLLLGHLHNKKWSTHGYTLQYQKPFQLSQKSLKYRLKHGFQYFRVTCDLWPWPFWWTLTEQKIFRSWLYTTIPKFNPIGQFVSKIEAITVFSNYNMTFDLWPWSPRWTPNLGAQPLMVIHLHTKNHSNRFSHLWEKLRTDGQTDNVKTIYPPLLCNGGYKHWVSRCRVSRSWAFALSGFMQ